MKRAIPLDKRDSSWTLKVLILVLSSSLALGSNYCFHLPAALKSQLQQHFTAVLTSDKYEVLFNLLYTLYSMPNVVLPFFGGLLVDKFGAAEMLLLLTSLVMVGQIIISLGSSMANFHLMLLGRMIYGIGGESLGVARSTLVASWFSKQELALALGIGQSFAGLAAVLNDFWSPWLADRCGVSVALWFGACMCGFSVVATLFLLPIDRRTNPKRNSHIQHLQSELMALDNEEIGLLSGETTTTTTTTTYSRDRSSGRRSPSKLLRKTPRITDIKHFSGLFWLVLIANVAAWNCVGPFQTVAESLLMERDFFRKTLPECSRCGQGNYVGYTDCHEIVPNCPSVPPFAGPLPRLNKDCRIRHPIDQMYCSVEPPLIADTDINCDDPVWKQGVLTKVYCAQKITAEKSAARAMSIHFLISLVAAPGCGLFVDRVGNRALIGMCAALVLSVAHFAIGLTHISIWQLITLQGAASCLFFCTLWPSIPFVVEERFVGSAYGACIAIGNFFLALVPLIVATLFHVEQKYLPKVEMLLASFALVASCSCCALWILENAPRQVQPRGKVA